MDLMVKYTVWSPSEEEELTVELLRNSPPKSMENTKVKTAAKLAWPARGEWGNKNRSRANNNWFKWLMDELTEEEKQNEKLTKLANLRSHTKQHRQSTQMLPPNLSKLKPAQTTWTWCEMPNTNANTKKNQAECVGILGLLQQMWLLQRSNNRDGRRVDQCHKHTLQSDVPDAIGVHLKPNHGVTDGREQHGWQHSKWNKVRQQLRQKIRPCAEIDWAGGRRWIKDTKQWGDKCDGGNKWDKSTNWKKYLEIVKKYYDFWAAAPIPTITTLKSVEYAAWCTCSNRGHAHDWIGQALWRKIRCWTWIPKWNTWLWRKGNRNGFENRECHCQYYGT